MLKPINSSVVAGAATLIQSAMCRTNLKHCPRPVPSKFYYPGLSTRPTFDANNFLVTEKLKSNAAAILKEYRELRKVAPQSDYNTSTSSGEHSLHSGGKWDWNSYILKGKRQAQFAATCPVTADVLEASDPRLMTDTPFSFSFFSTLHSNTSIAAHYGPCNLRLRCHFPLIVPQGGDCGMEIAGEQIKWIPNEPIFFDDCYEHRGK